MATPTPLPWTDLPADAPDVRLVACDMDGTLLRPDGSFPDGFTELLADLEARGILFVPASGRQYATLADMFAGTPPQDGSAQDAPEPLARTFLAENGSLVVHDGEVLSTTTLAPHLVDAALDAAGRAATRFDSGAVLCGVRSAYVTRTDEAFLAEVRRYYHRLDVVEDLRAVDDDVLKLALFTFSDAADLAEQHLGPLRADAQVVISGANWVDVMSRDADKGRALTALRESLGVSRDQTVAFGDYLNDLQMIGAAEWSFAVENAHEDVRAAAAWVAPSNAQDAVVVVLRRLLVR